MLTRRPRDLREVEQHFAFGENWASYARLITATQVTEATTQLVRLIGSEALHGSRFLDIGCGSGLHSVAALMAGASSVCATDIDPESVATAESVLERFSPHGPWSVRRISAFDLSPDDFGQFDVVYSWGVLHHTGDMRQAIARAAAMVAPGGLLCLALYARTPLCPLWRVEKRLYSRAPGFLQRMFRSIYTQLYRLRQRATGGDFRTFTANYVSRRGMDFEHDVHDWLGGYPYESITPTAAHRWLDELGFSIDREFLLASSIGLFGTGCHEFVFRKRPKA